VYFEHGLIVRVRAYLDSALVRCVFNRNDCRTRAPYIGNVTSYDAIRRENNSPIRTPTRFKRYGNEFESLYKVLGSDKPQQLRADS
jgi:hypothetical protein